MEKLVVKYFDGDLLDANVDFIFHQVNCEGIMGAGIAKMIKAKWPKVFNEYKSYVNNSYHDKDLYKVMRYEGDYLMVDITEYAHTKASHVVNVFGQINISERDGRCTKYDLVLNALERFCAMNFGLFQKDKTLDKKIILGFPYKFGCGLARGDWRIMEPLILSAFEKYADIVEVHFYKYN